MKKILLITLLLFCNCATYKQLKPKPDVSNVEQGYIELKRDQEFFKIQKNKKYRITFPAALYENFYLVLQSKNKQSISSFLTTTKKRKFMQQQLIRDDMTTNDSLYAFSIDSQQPFFYWTIDRVSQDMILQMAYRYVPQWRFKFESKYAEFSLLLNQNRIKRDIYESIGTSYHFEGFNFALTIESTHKKYDNLKQLEKQLNDIEVIFPKDIINSHDNAYLNYKKLRSDLDEEIQFQNKYLSVLEFFYLNSQASKNISVLLNRFQDVQTYFSQSGGFLAPIVQESKFVFGRRIEDIIVYYDRLLQSKKDLLPLDAYTYRLDILDGIYKLCENFQIRLIEDFSKLVYTTQQYNLRTNKLAVIRDGLRKVTGSVTKESEFPSNDFFQSILQQVQSLCRDVPQPMDSQCGKYQTYTFVDGLNTQLQVQGRECSILIDQYTQAAQLVPQLNILKDQYDYRGMLAILKQNKHLPFLVDKYQSADQLSLQTQAKSIATRISENDWIGAEGSLKQLHEDNTFLDLNSILSQKIQIVKKLEDSLFLQIDQQTRVRVQKFITNNLSTTNAVDALYTDSVFSPVYTVSFGSGTKAELNQRKQGLQQHLVILKEIEFPAQSIRNLYGQLIQNPSEDGVEKARAIVKHGSYYKGNDQAVKISVAECNPLVAKWITKVMEYRRVFLVPTNETSAKSNSYVLRLNIKVPSDAKFPVFDVNIKLPKEIAQNANTEQWFDKILLNKNPVKSEGRFSISTPTAANNFECQITPVQMNKDQNNILEIYFNHPLFRIFSTSVMVQKPIIKKN